MLCKRCPIDQVKLEQNLHKFSLAVSEFLLYFNLFVFRCFNATAVDVVCKQAMNLAVPMTDIF